jgi:hypothetical protein
MKKPNKGIRTVGDLIEIRIRYFKRSRITCVPVIVTKTVKQYLGYCFNLLRPTGFVHQKV